MKIINFLLELVRTFFIPISDLRHLFAYVRWYQTSYVRTYSPVPQLNRTSSKTFGGYFFFHIHKLVFIIFISLFILKVIHNLYKIQYSIIQVWSVFELLMVHILLNIPVLRWHVKTLLIFCLTMLTRTAHYILVTDGFYFILIFYFDAGYISMHGR